MKFWHWLTATLLVLLMSVPIGCASWAAVKLWH
jgi:hypothetical protein